jgi:RHS repeat-associated protein
VLRPLRPYLLAASLLATSTARADVSVGGDGRLESSIPIDVPSFHEITPSVQLSYSSTAGFGLAGAGWSLRAGSQITRQSATGGIANNSVTDHFVLDGLELVPCTSSSTSPGCTTATGAQPGTVVFYTTKLESFRRIRQTSDLFTNTSEFLVWDRDGITSRYTSVDGGVSYQLRAVGNLRGHSATYDWTCNQGCELDTIRYGGKNGAPGTEVRFYRESRPDPRVERVANGFWYHAERLRSIVVRNHGQLLRAYAFTYGDSLESRASILTGVQQFGRDAVVSATGWITAGATPPLPKRTFTTASLSAAGTFELSAETSAPNLFDTSSPALTPLAPRYPNGFSINADVQNSGDQLDGVTPNGLLAGDFNGDGRDEIVAWGIRDACTNISFRTYVTDNSGAAPTTISTVRDAGSTAQCDHGMTNARTFRLDVDGDSIDDVVLAIGDELRVYEGRPSGLFAVPTVSAWDSNTHDCVPADVDGDGRQDLVCELPGQIVVRRSTPYGWLVTTQSTSAVLPNHQFLELAAGDVDGDGLEDIILARAASGSTRVVLARSRGDGMFDFPDEQTFAFTGKLATGDVDGDGQLDLMWTRKAGTLFEVDVAVARKGYSNTRWISVPRQTTTLKEPSLADVDGDGRSDLVGITAAFEMRAQRATSDGMFGSLEAALATCPDAPVSGDSAQLMPADWNGDGLVDPTCVTHQFDAQYTMIERPGQPRGADRQRWQRADLDGDGRDELVYVAFKNPGYVVHVVSPATNQHRTFIANPTTVMDALREPDASRWVIADFGSPAGPADGKDDLVLVETVGGRLVTTTLLSTGLAAFQSVQQDVAATSGNTRGWFATTDDHDGRAALMRVANVVTPTTRVEWLKPTTAGNFARVTKFYFGVGSQWPIPDRAARRFHPTDVDADGLTDLVLVDKLPGSTSTIVRTLRADGNGDFVEAASTFTASWIGPRSVRIADLDGDGAPDLYHVARTSSSTAPCLSISHAAGDGHGGFAPGLYSGLACANATDPLYRRLFESSSSIVALDLDRDGRPELVHATHVRNASGTQQLVVTRIRRDLTGSIPQWRTTSFQPNVPYDLGDAWAWAPYQDTVSGDVGLSYVHPFVSQVLRWRRVRDEITQLSNGIGRVETISYGPLASGARAYLPSSYTPRVVYGTTIVDQAGTVPTIDSVQYGYIGATWSNEQGRLLGFATTSANDGRTVRFARYTLGETCGPQLNLSETQDLAGASWGWTSYTYGAVGFACVPKTTTVAECERTTSCRTAKFQQLGYDTYGNVTAVIETADQARLKITQTGYVPNTGLFIIAEPSSITTYEHDGTSLRVLAMEKFGYDYQAIGAAPLRGERTLSTVYDDQTGQDLKTLYNYDADGNVVSKFSPGNVTTTFDYDPTYRRYLTASCSALHCATLVPDLVLGAPLHVIAPNGGDTSTTYDAHGRVIRIQDPRGGATETQFLDPGVLGWQRIRTTQTDGSAGDGVLWTERYFDGNGRTVRTTREGGASATIVFADNSNRPSAISNIYPWGQTPKIFTDYTYDGIGRQIAMKRPDGATRGTTYAVGVRTESDELAIAQRFDLDGRGAAIRVIDPLSAMTQYKRDGLGRLIEIVDALGNVQRQTWSTRGLIKGSSDPDRGKVESTYTPDGALATRRDNKQQQQVYKYDALGRLESRNDLDASYNQVRTLTYTYDDGQAPHDASTGMLVAIDDSQANATISEEYWYDAGALVTQTQRCVDQTCMTEGVTYDIAGRIATRHYPDPSGNLGGEDVLHRYDDAGRLVGIGTYATLGYELDDALSSISYGNGVTQTFGYDPRRRSLIDMQVVLPSGDDATFSYEERDPVGRLLHQRVKGFIDVDLTYKYDALGRLRRVASPDPARVEVLNFDPIGRLTDLTGLGTFAYNDPSHVHGMTSTTLGGQRGYDANGNVTELADPTREITFEWTVDDRIAAARTPNGTYRYTYDFAGRRVRKEAAKSVTQYFGPRVELAGKGKLTTRYFAGNRVVAERTDQDVIYPIEDGNRNVRFITDANGNVTQKNEYTAFGKVMPQGSSPYTRTFSGAETETEDLGLVLMGARTYDPTAGQFLSADSIIPSLSRPQSLNRYSYVENDPINYNDPSGHMRLLIELRKLRFEEMDVLPSYEEAMLANLFVEGFDTGARLSDFRIEHIVASAVLMKGWTARYIETLRARGDAESNAILENMGVKTEEQLMHEKLERAHPDLTQMPQSDAPGSSFVKRAIADFILGAGPGEATSEGSAEPITAAGSRDVDIGGVPTVPPLYEGVWPWLAAEASFLGYRVTGTNERFTKNKDGKLVPAHNPGSAHYVGYAVDVRTWDHTNAQNEAFMETMRARGYVVLDERVRPPHQEVWGGPHIHVEAFQWNAFRDALRPLDQFRR